MTEKCFDDLTGRHEHLRFERHASVAVITIDRPEARNAINRAISIGIEHALDLIEADASIAVTILAGAGPVFSAGADLKAASQGRGAEIRAPRGGLGGLTRYPRTKPAIAAVEGLAVGGGFEMVLACDMVVASTEAGFGLPEVKRGMIAAGGGLLRAGRKLPPAIAMELALTGNPISAVTAFRHGLVNRLTDPGEAVASALELAGEIAVNAPLGLQLSRATLIETSGMGDDEGLALSAAKLALCLESEDYTEGVNAFVEKRAPIWKGR